MEATVLRFKFVRAANVNQYNFPSQCSQQKVNYLILVDFYLSEKKYVNS